MAIQVKIMERFGANNTRDFALFAGVVCSTCAFWQGDTSILQNPGGLH